MSTILYKSNTHSMLVLDRPLSGIVRQPTIERLVVK